VTVRYRALLLATLTGTLAAPAAYGDFTIAYGGRLSAADGSSVAGTVDLELRFYRDSDSLSLTTLAFPGVALKDGVFTIDVSLAPAAALALFEDPALPVWVEVVDTTHGVTYPKQRFSVVPYALRVPVDGQSLEYTDGQLAIKSVPMTKVTGLEAALSNKASSDTALGGDLGGTLAAASVAKLQGHAVATTTPTAAQVLRWDGSQWAPASVGGVSTVSASAPLAITNPTTTSSITLPQATASADGYLRQQDWTLFNNKQTALSAATSSVSGYLTSGDWTTFNAKQPALGYAPVNKAGDTMTGTLAMSSQRIAGLADPTSATDAATKNYADLSLGGAAFDQTSRIQDYVVKWDAATSKFLLAADQVGSSGGGIVSFNGLTQSSQTLAVGSGGTAPAFSSSSSTHTLNIPMANTGSVTAGLLANSEFATFNNKVGSVAAGTGISVSTSGTTATVNLANTSVSAGSYTRANLVVDAQGRITGASNSASINLASEVSGILPVTNGGTGATDAATARSAMGLGTLATMSAVGSAQITDGSISDADISSSAAIATTKLSGALTAITGHGLGTLATMSAVGSAQITDSSIMDADISSSAAIADTKLATISTAGKVANSATTAASTNTASAIVARDASGNFAAGTITAALSGNATTATTATTAGNVTGTVAVANGGTGATTLTANGVLLGNGTSALQTVAPSTSGNVEKGKEEKGR